jgi:hypothetical protein
MVRGAAGLAVGVLIGALGGAVRRVLVRVVVGRDRPDLSSPARRVRAGADDSPSNIGAGGVSARLATRGSTMGAASATATEPVGDGAGRSTRGSPGELGGGMAGADDGVGSDGRDGGKR